MRALPAAFAEYRWAPSTEEIAAASASIRSRSCASTATCRPQPSPTARPGAIAGALAEVNKYAHGGFPELVRASRGTRASSPRTSFSAPARTT